VKEANVYKFHQLVVSDLLESQHLFPLVMEFINEHLTGGENTKIVSNGTKYLAKALTPVWTEQKKTDAQSLLTNTRYHQNKINYFHDTWKSIFLDIQPLSSINWKSTLTKIYLCHNNDTLKPAIAIYADTTVFKKSNVLVSGDGYKFDFKSTVLVNTSKEKILLLRLQDSNTENQCYIFRLIQEIEKANKYSSSKKVSEWDWNKSDGQFSLESTADLRDYADNDKYELVMIDMNATYPEGMDIPKIHPWYPRTFCNVYASDMSRDILFPNTFTTGDNYAPWGIHQSAAKLHEELMNNTKGPFKAVTFDEAWQYTNVGYVVYLTAYNRRYYSGETKDPYSYSGHIATCYFTEKYEDHEPWDRLIIQAGNSCDVLPFSNGWSKGKYGTDNEHIKANLYLGYIIK
jgi:hypothetical protein